jgi:ecdysteroid 22-hydroxylase
LLPRVDETVKEFIELLPKRFDNKNVIQEMLEEVSRLNLELTCLIAFDERLNSFSDAERNANSRSSKLMKAADDTNKMILPTDQGLQLWNLFETSDYRKLREAQEYMEQVSIELVNKKKNGNGNSLLEQYFKNSNLDIKDLYGMAADLLLAGVHTSAYSTSFALYHISNDQRVQDLMFQEALRIMPKEDDIITPEMINSEIPYTRAVMKETLRLNPISIGVGRILNKDMVLGGFHVPKNVKCFPFSI